MNAFRKLILIASFLSVAGPSFAAIDPASTEAPMRRPEEALTNEQIEWVLTHVDHAVLSTADKTGTPYGVPITPFYMDGKIYFHGNGVEGRKFKNMQQNPKVSLCYIANDKINEPKLDVDKVSVVVAGTVRQITDFKEKRELMVKLLKRHTPSMDSEKEVKQRELQIKSVVGVYEITPDKISGKSNVKAEFFGKTGAHQ